MFSQILNLFLQQILHLITIRLYAEGEILCLRVLRGDFFYFLDDKFCMALRVVWVDGSVAAGVKAELGMGRCRVVGSAGASVYGAVVREIADDSGGIAGADNVVGNVLGDY